MKKLYSMFTVEEFIGKLKPYYAEALDAQTLRVVAKTTLNLAMAQNQSKKKGMEYFENMTPIQRNAMREFVRVANENGGVTGDDMQVMQRLGLL